MQQWGSLLWTHHHRIPLLHQHRQHQGKMMMTTLLAGRGSTSVASVGNRATIAAHVLGYLLRRRAWVPLLWGILMH